MNLYGSFHHSRPFSLNVSLWFYGQLSVCILRIPARRINISVCRPRSGSVRFWAVQTRFQFHFHALWLQEIYKFNHTHHIYRSQSASQPARQSSSRPVSQKQLKLDVNILIIKLINKDWMEPTCSSVLVAGSLLFLSKIHSRSTSKCTKVYTRTQV